MTKEAFAEQFKTEMAKEDFKIAYLRLEGTLVGLTSYDKIGEHLFVPTDNDVKFISIVQGLILTVFVDEVELHWVGTGKSTVLKIGE